MKNKKFKLFASLTSLVMVVALMGVGIWASANPNINVSSNINFTPDENSNPYPELDKLVLSVAGSINGTEQDASSDYMAYYTYGSSTEHNWAIGDLNLTGSTITYTLTTAVYDLEINGATISIATEVVFDTQTWTQVAGMENYYTNANLMMHVETGTELTGQENETSTTIVTVQVIDESDEVEGAVVNFGIAYNVTVTTGEDDTQENGGENGNENEGGEPGLM